MIVGTAGHIDHGKTALVKALTGVDADRLKEERTRGITIDLGYAYAPQANGEVLGFVDVPGHEKFIHNMLAGTTGIDFALLVVAADDGPMPQTVEHLQILDLLGIARGAVALSKIDRVSPARTAEVRGEISTLLAGIALAHASIFPVSSLSGEGIQALRDHLLQAAAGSSVHRIHGGFRLAVDRSFTVSGAGTVVTGTVFSGRVALGERLLISPLGRPVRVRGIHAQNRPTQTGSAGQRCALNLADIQKQAVKRGDWVLSAELHRPTTRLDVRLKLLASEAKALRTGTFVHAHLGAFHGMGRVVLLQEAALAPGASALAQLVIDQPTCASLGDHVVLRDASAQRTVAGGVVLDAHPPARGRRSAQRLAVLAAWEHQEPEASLRALAAASPSGVGLQTFAANVNLTAEELEVLRRKVALRYLEGAELTAFATHHWAALRASVTETLQKEHAIAPETLGLNAEQLRLRAAPGLDRAIFRQVLADLLTAGQCAREGSWWHLPSHRIVLSDADEELWCRLAPLFRAQPFQPPRVRDVARGESLPEDAVRKLLMQLTRTGRLYQVAHDHYFDRGAVADLAAIVRELARGHATGAVAAAAFRDRIGTGRKLAIQILEFFDRTGLTRRLNDEHRLRNEDLEY